jgi:hypothetical protein
MARRYARTYRRSSVWDARADATRAAAEAAGIPVREDVDERTDGVIDLRGLGGPHLIVRPARGKIAVRALDPETMAQVQRCSLKQLLHWLGDKTPRTLAPGSVEC